MSDFMTRFKEQELRLLICTIKNFNGNITPHVDWDKNSRDAGYKDSTNAKVMWSRLAKKIAETSFDNANQGPTAAPPAKMAKKRKGPGSDGDDEGRAAGSSTKGAKKPKTAGSSSA